MKTLSVKGLMAAFAISLFFCASAQAQHQGMVSTEDAGADRPSVHRTPSMGGHRKFGRATRPPMRRGTSSGSTGRSGTAETRRGNRSSHFARLPTAPRTQRPTRSTTARGAAGGAAAGRSTGRRSGHPSFQMGRVTGSGSAVH